MCATDGSIYYRNNHNFQVYGHQKFKIGNIESYGNVIAYASDFGSKWNVLGDIPGKPHAMHHNYIVFNPQGGQQYHNTATDPAWNASHNQLFGPRVILPGNRCPRKRLRPLQYPDLIP